MNRAARMFLVMGALSGATAVMAGAFGAHAIAESVTPERLATFRTGAQYQLIHSLALLLVGIIVERLPSKVVQWSGQLFLAGVILFSGSLYALVLVDLPAFGVITPFGGLAFICGWLLLAWGAWKAQAELSLPPQTES